MDSNQPLFYDSNLQLLICKVHGYGVQPYLSAITRHLRGKGHELRGPTLRLALSAARDLPLLPLDTLVSSAPSTPGHLIIQPIPHLKVLEGWACLPCDGRYLTTSAELIQRHAKAEHNYKRGECRIWGPCLLQTLFNETKVRRYFRVAQSAGIADSEQIEQHSSGVQAICSRFATPELQHELPHSCGVAYESPACLQNTLTVTHPFSQVAQRHIRWLSTAFFDCLFKSDAFRSASEPLFDPNHADASFNMQTVFAHCDDDPLFYHALAYSMVQFARHGRTTIEGCLLRSASVKLLNQKLSSMATACTPSVLGAIMVLKTTAYKFDDHAAHAIHAHGLHIILKRCKQNLLTGALRRSLFWQDLYASVFLDCERQTDTTILFDHVTWIRQIDLSRAHMNFPAGFRRCRDILPVGLLDCIADVVELKSLLPTAGQLPYHIKYEQLDRMQASLEDRLMRQAPVCRKSSFVAEACRLGVFFHCYCAWTEVWNDRFVLGKLAEKLLDVLETSLAGENIALTWCAHLDLFCWLLYSTCRAVELGRYQVQDFDSRLRQLIQDATRTIQPISMQTKQRDFCRALNDFLNFNGLTECTYETEHWYNWKRCFVE